MEFPKYASAETSALIAQLLGSRSGATLHQLQAVRDALDQAARALANPSPVDRDVEALVERLTAAAAADLTRARDEAQTAVQGMRDELQARLAAERERLEAATAKIEAESALLRSELQTALERADAAERDLTITVEAHAELEMALRQAEAEAKHAAHARSALAADVTQSHATIDQLRTEGAQLRAQLDRLAADNSALGAQLQATQDEAQTLGAQLQATRDEAQALGAQLQATRDQAQAVDAQLTTNRDETRALAAQLQAAREDAQAQRDSLTAQLDHARGERAALAALLDDARADHRHTVTQLDQAAGERAALNAVLDDARAEQQAAAARLEQARSENAALAARLDEARNEHRAVVVRLDEAQSQRDETALRLDLTMARMQALDADLTQARAGLGQRDAIVNERDSAGARVRELEAELAEARQARDRADALATQLAASSARVESLETQCARHEQQVTQLTTRLEDALQSEARLQEKLATRPADPGGEPTDVETLRAEVDRMVSLLDASARAVTEMAAATSSADLLTELLKRLSLQFSRVALFRVKGNRLEGEQQVGFDEATDVTKLVFPVTVDSILSRAVASKTMETASGADVSSLTGTPFGGAPTAAVAVPIVIQGAVIAVVYGDDADMPDWARGPAVHESSTGFARLLVGQAVVLLMRHTHELKTLAELRQYATTLVQEAKEMYLADAEAGKSAELLRSRLKDNLECASQLYAYRAAMEGTAAAALLDEQIGAELQESSPFARDLAAVIGGTGGTLHVTAEAS